MTAQDIIDQALLELGETAAGETPTTEERNDGLRKLNQLLDSWNAEQLAIPYLKVESFPLTGAETYTIGTGATDFDTARPLSVKAAFIKSAAGASQEADVVGATVWAQIRDHSRTGLFAEVLFYNPDWPSGKIYLSPMPGSGTLELSSLKPLTTFAGLEIDVDLPPGYDRALVFNLAADLAPQYGRDPNLVLGQAQQARAAIAQLNVTTLGQPAPVEPSPPAAEAA